MIKIKDDVFASELISKSLAGVISSEEQEALDEYVRSSSAAMDFSRLSALISQSVKEMTGEASQQTEGEQINFEHSDSDRNAPSLSDVAKERMRRSIHKEKLDSKIGESLRDDPTSTLRVAENETTYFTSGDARRGDGSIDEIRETAARFTLLQKIGEGGLGTVWLARDEKLRRNVALKEMSSIAAEVPKLWQRFEREAEITGHLEHPNVVPLYMSGVNRTTGLPFYAMRFLGKQTLLDAIQEYHARRKAGIDDPIDLHRLLNAFLDVCQAIAFAHSRGVVHRDLKPENVALDSFGQVLVLDWGLAKLDSDGELAMRLALSGKHDDSDLSRTLDGDVVGTPLYMAPEQALGELSRIDARTDVYGLGAILFAILTGDAPHAASHQSSDGTLRVREFLQAIAAAETPRPRDVNPSVPRDLEAICMRAMAKQKFARHTSATELAAEVERWIAGKHEKETRYDALRMAGRDLKSRLCVQTRQLAAAAQFMVELPPVQGLLQSMQADESQDYATWRERLCQILLALAKSKPNVSGLSFSQVVDDHINELARIERSLHDVANVRSLPQSRLRKGAANTFHKIVMQQFPGEFSIDFDCTTAGTVRLVCGVPVFDCQTEEPFGLVCAEAEIGNLVRPELEAVGGQDPVYLIDDHGDILFTSSRETHHKSLPAEQAIEKWPEILKTLLEKPEYLDADREYYATRLAFPQKNNAIHFVFTNVGLR